MQTPWLVILCKFKGHTEEPFPVQYYKDLFTANDSGSPWNMVRYFHDYSHGKLDLTGSNWTMVSTIPWYQVCRFVSFSLKRSRSGSAGNTNVQLRESLCSGTFASTK